MIRLHRNLKAAVRFLQERLEERERGLADRHHRSDRQDEDGGSYCACGERWAADDCPERRYQQADIAAKRNLLTMYSYANDRFWSTTPYSGADDDWMIHCRALELALGQALRPFAEHPGYDSTWFEFDSNGVRHLGCLEVAQRAEAKSLSRTDLT